VRGGERGGEKNKMTWGDELQVMTGLGGTRQDLLAGPKGVEVLGRKGTNVEVLGGEERCKRRRCTQSEIGDTVGKDVCITTPSHKGLGKEAIPRLTPHFDEDQEERLPEKYRKHKDKQANLKEKKTKILILPRD